MVFHTKESGLCGFLDFNAYVDPEVSNQLLIISLDLFDHKCCAVLIPGASELNGPGHHNVKSWRRNDGKS